MGRAFVEDSVLTQNIYILRKALKKNASTAKIKNIPRRGYVFEYEQEAQESATGLSTQSDAVPVVRLETLPVDTIDSDTAAEGIRRRPTRWVLALSAFVIVFAAGFAGYRYLNGHATVSNAVPGTLRLRPAGQASSLKTVAVLPFKSKDDGASASFARDISIRLGSVNKFNVVPMTLIRQYEKFGAELRADLVLNGELTIKDGRYSATAQMVNSADKSEAWSGRFEFDNIIQLQDAIANGAAKAVIDGMTDAERALVAKRLPTNISAYEHLQNGMLLWRDRREAEPYLTKAIELDASLARAYAALAGRYAMAGSLIEAEKALEKAFDLDDHLPDAYAAQGFICIFHYYDWDGAEKSLKSAVELDANNINARHWLAVFLSIHRQLDEAKAELNIALELDPTNPTLLADLGQLHYFAGDNATALEFSNKALEIDPAHSMATGYVAVINGPHADDSESLLAEAENALSSESFTLPYLNVDPKYDPVRTDPRFVKIIQELGL